MISKRLLSILIAAVFAVLVVSDVFACSYSGPVQPKKAVFAGALAVLKVQIEDSEYGPSVRPRFAGPRACATSTIVTLKPLHVYAGPYYPIWKVLWRCGDASRLKPDVSYIAAIFRIGEDLRGDSTYDYYGELPVDPCSSGSSIFRWTPKLDREVRKWVKAS